MINKQGYFPLIAITLIFTGIVFGMLCGQRFGNKTVSLSAYEQEGSNTPSTGSESQIISPRGKLNINFASVSDLMLLPGIGETYAQRIVDYRAKNGPFVSIDDLKNVKGIGEKRIEQISEYITVGG